jgi:hypothetical protein
MRPVFALLALLGASCASYRPGGVTLRSFDFKFEPPLAGPAAINKVGPLVFHGLPFEKLILEGLAANGMKTPKSEDFTGGSINPFGDGAFADFEVRWKVETGDAAPASIVITLMSSWPGERSDTLSLTIFVACHYPHGGATHPFARELQQAIERKILTDVRATLEARGFPCVVTRTGEY